MSCTWLPCITIFQSTLPSRGATKFPVYLVLRELFQSTLPSRGATCELVSPRRYVLFQSTLPSRGATRRCVCVFVNNGDFNPRSPRGERRFYKKSRSWMILFQSTLPSRGATLLNSERFCPQVIFQSTLPSRGATKACPPSVGIFVISIHAPLAGSDMFCL